MKNTFQTGPAQYTSVNSTSAAPRALHKLDPEWAEQVAQNIEAQQNQNRIIGEIYLPHLHDGANDDEWGRF